MYIDVCCISIWLDKFISFFLSCSTFTKIKANISAQLSFSHTHSQKFDQSTT